MKICGIACVVREGTDVLTTHEFWAGVPSSAVVGLAAPIIAARLSRHSDEFRADHEVKMDALKAEREDLKSNRQIIREPRPRFALRRPYLAWATMLRGF
jgi:hypothetical protein